MNRLKQAGLLWPSAVSMAALILLVWLGNWQMRRLAWKEGLISHIEQRAKAAPVSLDKAEALWRKTGDIEYLRVRATGRFDHSNERHYFTSGHGQIGWNVYTPLKVTNGRIIMVNRGFVTDKHKSPKSRVAGQKTDEFTIIGLLRKPGKKGLFTPDNNVRKNEWYWRDLSGMIASIGEKMSARSYPFFLDAGKGSRPAVKEPRAGTTRLKLTNKHLGYALTWYGLAATLIGVFAVFAWPRLRNAKTAG